MTEYNLAEKLGHMVGVSGSMTLARGIKTMPVEASQSQRLSCDEVQQYVLDKRARAIRSIQDSFSLNQGDAPTRIPSVAAGVRPEALKTFEPYQRFYITHQMELAVVVKELRVSVRSWVSAASAGLHQLAVLDQTLEESLDGSNRKLFNVIPKLLGHRFKDLANRSELLSHNNTESDEPAWILLFHADMREMLLAELDVRLQPVFGLYEALNEHNC